MRTDARGSWGTRHQAGSDIWAASHLKDEGLFGEQFCPREVAVIFENRTEAGRVLASALREYVHRRDVIVLGLPRGGVPVAFEVARDLGAPMDVFVVRKLGTPGQEELALGAIASGGTRVLNNEVVEALGIAPETIEGITQRERAELERRERQFRGDRPPLDAENKTVILVDDGLATGSTMRAAVAALRAKRPARIVVAVPVAAAATCDRIKAEVDEMICLYAPEEFYAVGEWYRDFSQTSDDEVRELLQRASGFQERAA
jgi:putative phosphoribosyl transferase